MRETFSMDNTLDYIQYRTVCGIPKELLETCELLIAEAGEQTVLVTDLPGLYQTSCTTEENGTVLNLISMGIDSLSHVKGLEKLTRLKILRLARNNLKNIEELKVCKNLIWLDLSKNQIEDLNPLSDLIHLKYLYASDNRLKGGLDALSDLKQLKELDLAVKK